MNIRDRISIYLFTIVGVLSALTYSCKKSDDTNPPAGNTVTDIDGNVYHTVTIGTQTWMVENLKTTKYYDGTSIPNVTDATWTGLTTPAYCCYNNANSNKATYGALYNWYAINTGKLCPLGWHVPTNTEWITLATYLGGESVAGGKLKEKGTTHWKNPNTGADNTSGFTALPAGYIGANGLFLYLGDYGYWWSSSESGGTFAWGNGIKFDGIAVDRNTGNKLVGFSVRCIKSSVD